MSRWNNWRWIIHGRLTIGAPLRIDGPMTLVVHGDLTVSERDGETIAVVTPVPWTRLAWNGLRRLRWEFAGRFGRTRQFPTLEDDK